jgi:D-sedoheptulose 7-phosphate isomerase
MQHHLQHLLARHPDLRPCVDDVRRAADLLIDCFRAGGKALFCGNGGSASDAEHLVGELMKGYLLPRPVPTAVGRQLRAAFPEQADYLASHLQGALPAISLVSQTSLITAIANDTAPDMVFAQQVYGYGREGDVVVGISTSGSAANVLHALRVGRALGLRALGFTGGSGGALKPLCDVAVAIPRHTTADIQEGHLAIYHALCAIVEEALFTPSSPSSSAPQ